MSYSRGSHTVFYHRYHIVWVPEYRYKVLRGEIRKYVRDVVRRVCEQMVKGRTSRKVQMRFPALKKRYRGRRFWVRGYFCTTSGQITNDIIPDYIAKHTEKP